ncbi:MAG: hypothetical protein KBG20_09710 [Caldilineaceae bacterium]|nr:hypothetical protein [Caldilineaceae bacterium]MBP8110445.1 hypothetical protein [Caldilineaceae bacterium]MBP8122110.1 hypothetical protein [Caldilineaceae bacterium]MBP9072565.1 hypothetical protein [Caldilineaceae bacterium]
MSEENPMNSVQILVDELHVLDTQLAGYEHRYGILSETFFAWFQSGEEPENPDWVQDFALWAGTYQLRLRRQEKYRRLITEVLTRRDVPALLQESTLIGVPG